MSVVRLEILGIVILAVGLLVFLAVFLHKNKHKNSKVVSTTKNTAGNFQQAAATTAEQAFNQDFREELRNSGRLHFENIVVDNAKLLNQSLGTTINQLNKQTQEVLNAKLAAEIEAYGQAMRAATASIEGSIQSTTATLEQQQVALTEALKKNVATREETLVKAYENNMAQIVEHYLLETLGGHFDLKTQLPSIIAQMEANKQAMIEDMRL
jgi:dsDNA-binding SOS-regulon protein